jgi:serine/threonine-protein kinase
MTDSLRDQLQASLHGTYTLARELGGGGMSRVFVAREEALGRDVVVKVLLPGLAEGLSAERFAREIRLAAALQEPHIVPVLAAGVTVDGLPYYTMPFVRGQSLAVRLKAGRIPLEEAVGVLRDVAHALSYAHRSGVVHRDIKPENVLLSDGTAVVADFGIAKAVSAARTAGPDLPTSGTLTGLGISIGTPAYMAPEQATGDVVDPRADIYAWGVVAYEMLAGRHPFSGKSSAQALIAAHIAETPARLHAVAQDVPAALSALVMRALAKDPADRPESAAALLLALDADSVVVGVRHRQPWRRTAAVAAGVLALVVLVLAANNTKRGTAPDAAGSDTGGTSVRSLAVVPFENEGNDTAAAYFAQGMSDEVAGVLAKMPELRVASRRSVDAVRARRVDVNEMANALAVAALLDGKVRRVGNKLRVSVQLTSARGDLLWGESYDSETNDAFALQDSIARAIAAKLNLELRGAALATSRAGRTDNPDAYDLYLRGRYAASSLSERGLRDAVRFYARALEVDSSFAKAQAGLGLAWIQLADAYVPAPEAYPKVIAAGKRALALDSLLPDGHAVAAYAHLAAWNWNDALRETERAVELDPGSSEWRMLYGQTACLLKSDGCAEGLRQLTHAVSLDPLSVVARSLLAQGYYLSRKYDDAIREQRRVTDLDSTFFYLDDYAAASWREKGDFDRSAKEYEALGRRLGQRLPGLAVTYAKMGRRDDALAIAKELRSGRTHAPPDAIAIIYSSLGEKELAFEWLDRARREHSALISALLVMSEYRVLHGDPRFTKLVRDVGLDGRR